jgi:uncharacterized protein (UPF0335 family)
MSKTDAEMVEEFITDKQDFETQMTLDFAKAILDCELQKKTIGEDIKDIKAEAKENGIQVQYVMKAVKALKAEMKADELEKREHESMMELLLEDSDIRFKIENLISK